MRNSPAISISNTPRSSGAGNPLSWQHCAFAVCKGRPLILSLFENIWNMADEQFTSLDNMDISKLKVSDLKRELKARGLNSSGNKMELAQRLTDAIQSGKNDDGSADSVDELIDEDDVLNDDEIEEEVDNMKNTELEVSDRSFENDSPAKPLKRKVENNSSEVKSAKKIVLNRKLSTEILDISPTETTNGNSDDKKVVKLSELSAKERLEMRAKKFGMPLSTDAKKEVRAQRFGGNDNSTSNKTPITFGITPAPSANIDVLKKRAERFGTVSTQLIKVESEEKLEKRKARFGSISNGTSNSDQKAKRLERFKITLK